MIKRYLWKLWLRLNQLTKGSENDYYAEVSTVGKTLTNRDIARLFIESGSELSLETLIDILDRADRLRVGKLCEGYSVRTGFCRFSPRVLGKWVGASQAFDFKEHRLTVNATVTDDLYRELESVGVEVLGIRDGGAYIGLVKDVNSLRVDGKVSAGGQIVISGNKIKVEGEDVDSSVGVFLEGAGGSYRLSSLAINFPKEIVALVPDVPLGEYSLFVVTRYSGGMRLLLTARRIEYGLRVEVI